MCGLAWDGILSLTGANRADAHCLGTYQPRGQEFLILFVKFVFIRGHF